MKSVTLYLTLGILLSGQALVAQTWSWAKSIGGTASDKCITVKTNTAGEGIVSGYFSENMSLGNGVNLVKVGSGKDIFVAKYDNAGVCQWGKSGGDTFDDRILGMDVDKNGNVYCTGTCWFDITMGGVSLNAPASACCDQCFVYKLDPNGNVLWGTMAGGMGDDQGLDLITDDQGNTYVAGFMSSTDILLGPTLQLQGVNTGSHVYNYWVGKISPSGTWLWGTSFGSLPWDPTTNKYVERDIAIALGDDNDIYVTGGYDQTRTFGNTTLTSVGGTDVFLLKMDTTGAIQWAISGGSDEDDWANAVACDSLGHVYVTGEHRDSLYFGSTLIKNYKRRDVFVAKFDDVDGSCIWGKRAGGDDGGERGNDVYADKNCNVYLTGEVGKKANFGADIETDSIGSPQMFVARISPDGDWMWAVTGGSLDSADIRSNSICPGLNRELYVCGNFRDYAEMGSTPLNSMGKTDGFIAKLKDESPYTSCFAFLEPWVNAGVVSILSPEDTLCSIKVFPKFTLTNIGNQPLISATIEYSIDGGAPISFNWTGLLDSAQTEIVNLPTSFTTTGNHNITITIVLANGVADTYLSNNALTSAFFVTNTITQPLPYTEGFEGAIFPPLGVTLLNPNSGITWESTNAASALGVQSMRIRNYNNNLIGDADDFVLPDFDFSNTQIPLLSFDVAYASYTSGATDTLDVLISVDCGDTYETIAHLYGNTLATAPSLTSPFVPNATQWAHKVYNLSAYGGNPSAKILFRNLSGYENTLYLDNINLIIQPNSISTPELGIDFSLYPNPATEKVNITCENPFETESTTLIMQDITGKALFSWEKQLLAGNNEWEIELPSLAQGVYFVTIQTSKGSKSAKLMVK